MEKEMVQEVMSYKCNWCGTLYSNQTDAYECAFKHAKYNLANSLLESGRTLRNINYHCGFNWNLTKEQEEITKDNCFIFSHWQCCEKPAYKIVEIDGSGKFRLRGKGSLSGYYGDWVRLDRLAKPYPKESLFIDPR